MYHGRHTLLMWPGCTVQGLLTQLAAAAAADLMLWLHSQHPWQPSVSRLISTGCLMCGAGHCRSWRVGRLTYERASERQQRGRLMASQTLIYTAS
jgi:hypothetical protein